MIRHAHVLPVVCVSVLAVGGLISSAEQAPQELPPSPQAVDAMRLLDSSEVYQQELGFLRLEALREPSTVKTIRRYLDHPNADVQAYSLRAIAAIQGAPAVPLLLERLHDRHPTVRRAALLGLEPLQPSSPEILPACIKALKDRSTDVRIVAVDIVSRIDDPRAREAIHRRQTDERRRDVRRVLKMASKRIEP